VLKRGVSTIAQPVEPPPPPPRANNGRASNPIQTNTNVGLIKRFFIGPPRRIELS
jgi:hypothetical protein